MMEIDPMSIWSTEDDALLVAATLHVNSLKFVHQTVEFSRVFSFEELKERHHQLMYDPKISKEVAARINQIPISELHRINARTPFSREEEACLLSSMNEYLSELDTKTSSTRTHYLDTSVFKKILKEKKSEFHTTRTPQYLENQFWRLGEYAKAEKGYDKHKNKKVLGESKEFGAAGSSNLPSSSVIQKAKPFSIFKNSKIRYPIAKLVSECRTYYMKRTKITMGNGSEIENDVDIDLSVEEGAGEISGSGQQVLIWQCNDKQSFGITNTGQSVIYVNGKRLPQFQSANLPDGAMIQIRNVLLVFKTIFGGRHAIETRSSKVSHGAKAKRHSISAKREYQE